MLKFMLIKTLTCKVSRLSIFSIDHTQKSSSTSLTTSFCWRNPAAYKNSVAPNMGNTLSLKVALEHLILWNFVSSGLAIMLSRYRHNTFTPSTTWNENEYTFKENSYKSERTFQETQLKVIVVLTTSCLYAEQFPVYMCQMQLLLSQ